MGFYTCRQGKNYCASDGKRGKNQYCARFDKERERRVYLPSLLLFTRVMSKTFSKTFSPLHFTPFFFFSTKLSVGERTIGEDDSNATASGFFPRHRNEIDRTIDSSPSLRSDAFAQPHRSGFSRFTFVQFHRKNRRVEDR